MCQEAEMNVLSVTLAESKDMADRLALQTRQLQSNNEVLEAAYECSLQRQNVFHLLLEASDLKALRMAIKVWLVLALCNDCHFSAKQEIIHPSLLCSVLFIDWL